MQPIEGYVAFLDVLGFSDLISRDDSLLELNRYVDGVANAVNSIADSSLELVQFSDSIVISTGAPQESDLGDLVTACSRVFTELLLMQVPVRGAIAYGKFIRDGRLGRGAVVAGRPVNEALEWERKQNWVGISLAPSVLRKIADLERKCWIGGDDLGRRLGWVLHLTKYDHIPVHFDPWPKDSQRIIGYAVAPLSRTANTKDISRTLDTFKPYIEAMRVVAPDPSSQQKCTELLTFLTWLGAQWAHLGDIGTSYDLSASYFASV